MSSGQQGLSSEFQDSLGCRVRSYFKPNKLINKIAVNSLPVEKALTSQTLSSD